MGGKVTTVIPIVSLCRKHTRRILTASRSQDRGGTPGTGVRHPPVAARQASLPPIAPDAVRRNENGHPLGVSVLPSTGQARSRPRILRRRSCSWGLPERSVPVARSRASSSPSPWPLRSPAWPLRAPDGSHPAHPGAEKHAHVGPLVVEDLLLIALDRYLADIDPGSAEQGGYRALAREAPGNAGVPEVER